jgi:hypothetical protein
MSGQNSSNTCQPTLDANAVEPRSQALVELSGSGFPCIGYKIGAVNADKSRDSRHLASARCAGNEGTDQRVVRTTPNASFVRGLKPRVFAVNGGEAKSDSAGNNASAVGRAETRAVTGSTLSPFARRVIGLAHSCSECGSDQTWRDEGMLVNPEALPKGKRRGSYDRI